MVKITVLTWTRQQHSNSQVGRTRVVIGDSTRVVEAIGLNIPDRNSRMNQGTTRVVGYWYSIDNNNQVIKMTDSDGKTRKVKMENFKR